MSSLSSSLELQTAASGEFPADEPIPSPATIIENNASNDPLFDKTNKLTDGVTRPLLYGVLFHYSVSANTVVRDLDFVFVDRG